MSALTRLRLTDTHAGQVSQTQARRDRGRPQYFPSRTDTSERTILAMDLRRLIKGLASLKAVVGVSGSGYRPDLRGMPPVTPLMQVHHGDLLQFCLPSV